MGELFGGGSLGGGGAGTVGTCGKHSFRETVQPVGVGINVICKVTFTPTGGIAVFPKDWCSGASISDRQSCKSATVGMGGGLGLACLCRYIVAHRGVFCLEGGVFSMKSWDNLIGLKSGVSSTSFWDDELRGVQVSNRGHRCGDIWVIVVVG